MQDVLTWIGVAAFVVDVLGVGVIILGIVAAFLGALRNFMKHRPDEYDLLRVRIGKALLLGLEFLVAADVIRTVVLDLTLENLLTLGLLVVIRTALSWTLVVEIEDRWPWQKSTDPAPA
ncbi:MAG TPA: DUF1622 domain-containing protein [Candidatus Bathyarchaeia archaeon]|nr:DUF1622 domain-containing protein [Candidatus Bathyarchaeia archaeon]